jgi:VWFA-related protein
MRAALLFILTLAALSSAAAQTSGETFKTGVTAIQVPVVVRDHDGHVVTNLGKDDFQLFDNGKRQEITSFSMETPGGQAAPDRSLPAAAPASGAQAAVAGTIEIPARFVAYFFDDITIRDFGDLKRIRDAAAQQLGALQPGDRAAIFMSSCTVQVDFTNDRQKLQEALSRLQLRPPQLCRVSQAQTLQAELLRAVVKRMSTLPARRDIILISSGFYIGHDKTTEEADLIEAAIRAKVSISAVDVGEATDYTGGGAARATDSRPRYDNPTNPVMLVDLAHGTGGTYVTGNDFALSFRKLATPEIHYLLGFVPTGKADGRFHQLKVKLENAHKLTVEARNGYYATPRTE